ncbi:hypothetical protein ANO11243_034600 [Dothideomycetidae sp. 11243]|nr:hypothetical protein ANO11243_034600 [fungal sp. No.11243]
MHLQKTGVEALLTRALNRRHISRPIIAVLSDPATRASKVTKVVRVQPRPWSVFVSRGNISGEVSRNCSMTRGGRWSDGACYWTGLAPRRNRVDGCALRAGPVPITDQRILRAPRSTADPGYWVRGHSCHEGPTSPHVAASGLPQDAGFYGYDGDAGQSRAWVTTDHRGDSDLGQHGCVLLMGRRAPTPSSQAPPPTV